MRLSHLATLAAAGLMVASTQAQLTSMKAEHDPQAANFFTLDFQDGTPRNAEISATNFDLRLDAKTGAALFVSYQQQIDSIDIPIGGGLTIPTGEITVRVVPGSSTGTFDAEANTFSTQEDYEISFTEDLSAIGFVSPVILPSSSTGTVTFDPTTGIAQIGQISQIWEGETQVGAFPLLYRCEVNTTFQTRLVGDMSCDGSLGVDDIGGFVGALTDPNYPGTPLCDASVADVNGDGAVTVGDINGFVELVLNG